MHRIKRRKYVGSANETVTVTTRPSGGGQSSVILDGQPVGPNARFALPATPGAQRMFQVALSGPLGADCVVGIATVDGGTDSDFLICLAHNPLPVNTYSCSVVSMQALTELATLRGTRTAEPALESVAPRAAKGKKKAARKPARKTSKKTGKKKGKATAKKKSTRSRKSTKKGGRK
jgi:hypothetical protein